MRLLVLVVALACVACACALSSSFSQVHVVPRAWERVLEHEEVADLHPMVVTLAVKQQNLDELERVVLDVSTPHSENYGKHWDRDAIQDLVAPREEDRAVVFSWLEESDVSEEMIEDLGDFVVLHTNVGSMKRLFSKAVFALYRHTTTDEVIARAVSGLNVPEEVADVLDFIGGLHSFPKRFEKRPVRIDQADDTNAPYMARMLPGSTTLASFFMPRCKDGSPTANPEELCKDNAPSIESTNVMAFQYGAITQYKFTVDGEGSTSTAPMDCRACSDWTGSRGSVCAGAVSSLGLDDSAVFCTTGLMLDFVNYVEIMVNQTVTYSDGEVSDVAVYGTPFYLGEYMTPEVLLRRYSVPTQMVVSTTSSNTQSVAEFLGQFYNQDDLDQFFDIMAVVPADVTVIGPNDMSNPGGEASLDIQFLMGIAQNISTTFWSLGNLHDGQEPFLEWILEVNTASNPPLVHSISYGDDEPSLDVDYMQRIDTEFQKAGARGLTICFSSGDNGVNSADPSNGDSCTVDAKFVPSFPASSPFVTAVGGTQFSTGTVAACLMDVAGVPVGCQRTGEITSSIATGSRITSGGGFSNVFEMPNYQKSLVTSYLNDVVGDTIPDGYYNATGRAYPDVSACARNFLVVINSELNPIDGTSAAAPTLAGLVSIMNEWQLQQGKAPLGFINPLLYGLGADLNTFFNDIVMGDNSCGEDIDNCCPYGFPAALGWDASTGLGTPKVSSILSSLP